MRHTWLAVMVLVLTAATAQAGLEVTNIQCAYGPLLPERKELQFYPEDLIFFRYLVRGAKVDARGEVDCEARIQLTDSNGKEVAKNTLPYRARLSLGGDTFAGVAYVVLNEQLISGSYTLKVTVVDHAANEKTMFQREVRVQAAAFAIIRPRFFADAEGRVPAPVSGMASQSLFFRIEVYGFDKSQERVHLISRIQVVDDKGKELLPEPLETVLKSEDAKVIKATNVVTFNGSLGLHRPGDFTLRFTVQDRLGEKTTKLELPLHVALP